MNINLIYITAGDMKEAETIGKALVTSRMAACVNLIDKMKSFYRWDGALQEDSEVILIAKTTDDKVQELIEKVKAMHSYDCPCIISLPVSSGNRSFMDWIVGEVN